MKTKEEILEEIVKKQDEALIILDELITFHDCQINGDEWNKLHDEGNKLKDEINALKSQLSEAGEEKRNKLLKAYSDLVIEIDKHKGTTIKEVKLRNKIANLKLEIR